MPIEFPEPKSLNLLEIVDGKDHRTMVYSVEKPHPGYGKDPNILNEFGHSVYPKMVYPNGNTMPGKIVNSEQEEKELLGTTEKIKDDGGPTIKEYVEAGYKASTYPPKGYKSKSNKEEIDEYIKKEQENPAKSPWGA